METKSLEIKIEHQPNLEKLQQLGVCSWANWTKEASKFSWTYDCQETCYLFGAEVTVTRDNGISLNMGKGGRSPFLLVSHYVIRLGH